MDTLVSEWNFTSRYDSAGIASIAYGLDQQGYAVGNQVALYDHEDFADGTLATIREIHRPPSVCNENSILLIELDGGTVTNVSLRKVKKPN